MRPRCKNQNYRPVLSDYNVWPCTQRACTVPCCNFRYVGHMIFNYYGPGYGRIWLDNVQCSGSESSVGDCQHSGWGVHDCVHGEDVAIFCRPPPSPIPPSNSTFHYSRQRINWWHASRPSLVLFAAVRFVYRCVHYFSIWISFSMYACAFITWKVETDKTYLLTYLFRNSETGWRQQCACRTSGSLPQRSLGNCL